MMAESSTMASHSSFSKTSKKSASKQSEVIQNSKQIAPEPIPTYLLNTVREDLGNEVRRFTFGKKDSTKRSRTILIVGETGTGKSALINAMLNYMLGVKWEDCIRFEIISDEGKKSQTKSQTFAITAYQIYGLEDLTVPFSLTVIDTPGYGDTGGAELDKRIAPHLFTLLSSVNGVQQIDAVCLVVKSTQNRLSPSQNYVFDTILSLFGKNLEKNILTLITFSDWMPPSEALEALIESGVPFAKDESNEPVHFLFNNSPCKGYHKKYENKYKKNWEAVTGSMGKFFQTLDEMETQNFRMTENVLKERQRLEACIQSWEKQIEVVEMKQKSLEEVRKQLEEHKEDMRKNNNFTYSYKEMVIKKVPTAETTTCCPKCQVNCHSPCTFVSDLSWCTVMKGGKCTVCPHRCSYEVHEKAYTIYAPVCEERTGTYDDLRKKTEGAIATQEEVFSNLERELKDNQAKNNKLLEKCFLGIKQLRDLALKFDSDATLQSIERLTDMLKKNNMIEKVKELQEILGKTKLGD